jgi:hypothetical protein
VNVLPNDSDADGQLDASSVVVATPPAMGEAAVQADGQIRFTPPDGFSGEVTFSYTVADDDGARSVAASVTITVAPPPWQNPQRQWDVNDDGIIDLADLLPVVNYLRSDKPRAIETVARTPADGYVDVDGDNTISLADLLDVVIGVRAALAQQTAESEAERTTTMTPPAFAHEDLGTTAVDLIANDIARRKRHA